jgi:hypothetical protein
MDSMERLRCGPRNWGMMQKAHLWSQPSEALRNALYEGVARRRGVAWS